MTTYTELPKPKSALATPSFSKLAFSGSLGGGGGGGGGGGLPRGPDGKIIWPEKKKPHSAEFGADRVRRLEILLGQ
jgi:hypothetical protein